MTTYKVGMWPGQENWNNCDPFTSYQTRSDSRPEIMSNHWGRTGKRKKAFAGSGVHLKKRNEVEVLGWINAWR